jgi:CubicO group peptidase (beta-lactamase class C family)
MPATSEKQKKFMDAAAHNPAFAKAAGVPTSVAKDFSESSKGLKFGRDEKSQSAKQSTNKPKTNHGAQALFSKGGKTMAKSDAKEDMKMDKAQDKAMIKKAFKQHDAQEHKGGSGTKLALKKGGMTKMSRGGGVESKGKTKGTMIAMCGGGMSKKK